MTRRWARRIADRSQRGAAAVEFALLLPLLVAMLSGIITAGIGYNNALGLADGVRGGARFGATTVSSSSWGLTVQLQTIDLTFLNTPGLAKIVTTSMVCAQLVRAPSTVVQASSCSTSVTPPANPAGVVAGTCLVKVWAKIPVTLQFILIPSATVIVNRQSVALYERGTC